MAGNLPYLTIYLFRERVLFTLQIMQIVHSVILVHITYPQWVSLP